jgi:hypothetical protein
MATEPGAPTTGENPEFRGEPVAPPSAPAERERKLEAAASDLCAALTHASALRVEDIPGGIAITMTPHAKESREVVREDAQRFQQSFAALAAEPTDIGRTSGCNLANLPKLGATTSITDTGPNVRILLTSTDPTNVDTLRQELRAFARANLPREPARTRPPAPRPRKPPRR